MIVLVALPPSVSSKLIMSVRVVQQSVACIPNTAEHARPMPCSTVVQVLNFIEIHYQLYKKISLSISHNPLPGKIKAL